MLDQSNASLRKEYEHQSRKLALLNPDQEDQETGPTQAAQVKFVTPLDPVVETVQGQRLSVIPVAQAVKLNSLKDLVEGREPSDPPESALREGKDGSKHGASIAKPGSEKQSEEADAPLRQAIPNSRTNPLFPDLPVYGPPTRLRSLQCWFFRSISSVLSLCFLIVIVMGAIVAGLSKFFRPTSLQGPGRHRPFLKEELQRREERKAAEKEWAQTRTNHGADTPSGEKGIPPQDGEFVPTEGGPDPLCVDIAYYARRVGLDAERFDVQTEDGFIIDLWHIFNPREYKPPSQASRGIQPPDVFQNSTSSPRYAETNRAFLEGNKKYPILMMHGLLQSAGAFCANDDDSLAFYLAKSGYDVWLGNNRCGFEPRHTSLKPDDPRFWAWNVRQMGVMDLPALISRVLTETGFSKLGLIAHSQGTTQTLVALAKEQRPEIGEKISVFCALAPAAYSGPLIKKAYFRFMQLISPGMFRLVFGIHNFIEIMMFAHKVLPARPFSWMGYHVFSFLFSWSDSRWDRDLRDRMFQWAPSYVSAESMAWWLGRTGFATQKCILSTREEGQIEDEEDEEDDAVIREYYADKEPHMTERQKLQRSLTAFRRGSISIHQHDEGRGRFAWYDERFPPLALWVAGADDLVDGRRLLRRFERGREPHVNIVHQKIIEGYEHLDVIWAMDSIEKVGKEVREIIWRTASPESQRQCRTPIGCDRPHEEDPHPQDVPMVFSGGRERMASISKSASKVGTGELQIDASKNAKADQEKYQESRREAREYAQANEGPDSEETSENAPSEPKEKE